MLQTGILAHLFFCSRNFMKSKTQTYSIISSVAIRNVHQGIRSTSDISYDIKHAHNI